MKKKILTILFGAFLIALFLPKNSLAFCRTNFGSCPAPNVSCSSPDGISLCCSPGDGGCDQPAAQNPRNDDDIIPSFNTGGNTSGNSNPSSVNSDPTCQGGTGINTAIGCITVLGSQEAFLGDLLKWAIGVGGGIAFLLIIYAGFMIMTSSGNPDRLKAGQELLTSALSGLILLIFSVFILNLIGVKILQIPGFGTN